MLSETIRHIRLQHGLSTERLGAMLGVSGRTVWNWEQGRTKPNRYHSIVLEKMGYAKTDSPTDCVQEIGRDTRLPKDRFTNTVFIVSPGCEPERNEQ